MSWSSGRQFAPAGLVAAQQGIGPGADDEFIGRIVAAAGEDGGLLGGEDGALVGPGPGRLDAGAQCRIAELAGLAHIGKLGRRLHRPEPADQIGRIDQLAEAGKCLLHLLAVEMGEAIGIGLDAEPLAGGAEIPEHVAQLIGRAGAGLVGPDADVLDDRGVPGLPQIGGAGQERQPPIGSEIEALEEAEAERVVAGEVVHALLIEHQEPVQLLLLARSRVTLSMRARYSALSKCKANSPPLAVAGD